ncbi:MAG: hypothetical protein LBT14_10610, partial [Treponema sp.]|nr:hypothetical protein [Treponema sp.]
MFNKKINAHALFYPFCQMGQHGHHSFHIGGPLLEDGIFVNANQLHFGAGAVEHGDSPECMFHCLRFNPSLLCAHPYIEARFVNPLLYDSRFDAIFFPAPRDKASAKDWRATALLRVMALMELTIKENDDSALEAQSLFYDLWALLFSNTMSCGGNEKATTGGEDLTIKRMISFIHKNYHEKITLDDIAKAGMVCRSKC